ncbi:MAG: nitric oxide reductase activation protein NorD [Pseudooceanicola nanhaiensis]
MLAPELITSAGITPELRAAFPGAMLDDCVAAHQRLTGAGYGAAVPRTFLSVAPRVARLAGPDEATALANDASRIAIRSRPRVAALYLETAVPVARRLGSEGFARWRRLYLDLLTHAPESLLPLVERAEMLLDRLSFDALEGWIATGLRLAGGDRTRRLAFFRLETAEAQRLLERHAGEDTFQSLEHRLAVQHTALWGRRPVLREAVTDAHGISARRTSFADGVVRLPASFPGFRGREELLYRASLAHVGAHLAYGHGRFEIGQLKPMQIALVSLIEDARVETLALREMPGLIRLWRPFHEAQPDGVATAPSLFGRLARALIDPDFPLRHGWLRKGVEMFRASEARMENPAISRHIGNLLGNDLGQTRVQFNAKDYLVQPAYRDDNLGVWNLPPDPDQPPPPSEMTVEVNDLRRTEVGDGPDDRDEKYESPEREGEIEEVRASDAPAEDGRALELLPEYDHAIRRERPDWVTVKAYEPALGDPQFWSRLEKRHGATLARIRSVISAAEPGRRRRLKRQAEGEKLDLDAAVEATIDLRSGQTPDRRVYEGSAPPERSIAVHLLLDISRSTGDAAGAGSILDMERDAAAILASAMDRLGDALAITAFSSAGREDLRVVPVKTFDEPLGLMTGMALSGLRPGYSTRMGGALRYAGRMLERMPRHRRMVLLVTDGEPSDIDVPDPTYLAADARRAVQAMRGRGIDTFCIALGPATGRGETEIFGRSGQVRIPDIAALPEKLASLYLKMTG